MNVITRTYSNSMSQFINNTDLRSLFDNTSEAQPQNAQKFSPAINGYSADPIFQPFETNKSSGQNDPDNNKDYKTDNSSKIISGNDAAFTQAEIELLEELKETDTKVKQHEMAHIAAGGKYITSGVNFTYQQGPDGKNYAVGGEVRIDTSPVPGDPEATIKKMNQVKSAALAPADPSPQDLKVAADATSEVSKALSELMISQIKDQATANEKKAFGNLKKAADSYEKTSSIPDKEISSFQIAV